MAQIRSPKGVVKVQERSTLPRPRQLAAWSSVSLFAKFSCGQSSVLFVKTVVEGSLRLKGQKPEARRAESGEWGSLEGPPLGAPPHQLRGLEERCKLPQWRPGRSFCGILLLEKHVY